MTSDRYTICPDCGMHMAPGEADEHMRGHVAQQRGGEDRFELMTNADGTIVRVPRY